MPFGLCPDASDPSPGFCSLSAEADRKGQPLINPVRRLGAPARLRQDTRRWNVANLISYVR